MQKSHELVLITFISFVFSSIVRELVKQDKNSVNDEDENSNTALHLAALAGHAKVADVLIEMGADVAAR